MKKYLLATAILGASSLANAGAWEAAATINNVWVNAGIVYGSLINSPLPCGSNSFKLIVSSTDSEKSLVMSILLSAKVSGEKIQVHTTGDCSSNMSYIDGVRML